tara:strand:+ start:4134 stop:4412 length:279 start_codon:yes stop_codon:yes gene_type:complete
MNEKQYNTPMIKQHREDMVRIGEILTVIERISPEIVSSFHAGYRTILNEVTPCEEGDGIPTANACITAARCRIMVETMNMGFVGALMDHIDG